jgi:lipid-A-disaccharide synthase
LINTPPLRVFVVAGESSGDQLGAGLMRALCNAYPGKVVFAGVGGAAMEAEGLSSLFPMADIAVMGFLPVIRRLPLLLRRIRATVDAAIASPPDVMVLIDSPDFTRRVARPFRAAHPDIPIVTYVSPTVWAWRPGRARAMRLYVDHLMAVLPFEPAAHLRLGGPPTTYVGHPLIARLQDLRPQPGETRDAERPVVLVLPGSRRSEIAKLMPAFGEAVALIAARVPQAEFVLPAVPHVRGLIETLVQSWPVKPHLVAGEAAKLAAFRRARVALAAHGTVTLELALAQVPMVVGYRVSKIEEVIARRLITVTTGILPNLIIAESFVPEFLQDACTGTALAGALLPLIPDGAPRSQQLSRLEQVEAAMRIDAGTPSDLAAKVVLSMVRR